MFASLALGALSAGGQLLAGLGAKQASAKQARLQMIADGMARQANEETLARVNARREEIGKTLLDARNVVATAESAGFNPVTWINAGGLGYMTDSAKFLVPEYTLAQASQVPQQHSALSAFGNALSAGASAFGTQYRADQSYDLQLGKMAMGLSNAFGGLGGGSTVNYGMGSGVMSGTSITGGGSASGNGALSNLPYPQKWKPGEVNMTNPWFGMNVDKTFADAEAFEARYGDIAQEVAGARNLIADSWLNTFKTPIGVSWGKAWSGSPDPWTFNKTPAGQAWNWLWNGSQSEAGTRAVSPYLPFAQGGAGVTYAW